MESLHSFLRMHWDHESEWAKVGQASRLPYERESASKNVVGFADRGRRDARFLAFVSFRENDMKTA